MSKTELVYKKQELPKNIMRIGIILLIAGLAAGLAGYFINPERAAFSYLVAFMFLLSIGIGSLFMIALEYITGAVWSVPFRRISEFLSSILPWLLILVIPLLFSLQDLFHWSHEEAVAGDKILQHKSSYLNTSFFIIRTFIVFGLWSLFYLLLIRNSRKQDETGDQYLTKKNIVLSGIFIPVFAFTITVSAVDWMMSLEPHWFSTIFGVYFFSGAVWSALAAITLIVVNLVEKGYLHPRNNTDHYYSLGTLLFAFTCFWGYIAFSQYMLIWYADLPEENFWFIHRWEGIWFYISILLIIAHFIVPFFSLLSHQAKTNPARLKFMSIWILSAHLLDLYWLILPNIYNVQSHLSFSWMDLVFPVASVGLIVVLFKYNADKTNLIPVGDPKLEQGLEFSLHEREVW